MLNWLVLLYLLGAYQAFTLLAFREKHQGKEPVSIQLAQIIFWPFLMLFVFVSTCCAAVIRRT